MFPFQFRHEVYLAYSERKTNSNMLNSLGAYLALGTLGTLGLEAQCSRVGPLKRNSFA